jgi:AraC-like DNA-binding protein
MEAQFRKLITPPNASFIFESGEMPYLPTEQWHYHPEFELIVFMEGKGTRIIGDNVDTLTPGELLLIGPNLPHAISFEKKSSPGKFRNLPHMTVIQFDRNFLGKEIWERTEFFLVQEMLDRASRGIRFTGPVVERVCSGVQKMQTQVGVKKIMTLLCLLEEMASCETGESLSNYGFIQTLEANDEKITRVYEYTLTHFRDDISLETVAALVYLSQSAFCRFFKLKTGKTYTEFLTEVRIGYACKLLLQEKLNVSQICYECGYRNLSNFNRYFKEVTQNTPSEYVQQFHSSVSMGEDFAA